MANIDKEKNLEQAIAQIEKSFGKGSIMRLGDYQTQNIEVIPITKVTLGFVSGGGEYYSELKEIRRDTEYPFSGGCGGGVSIQPIGFLVVQNNTVEFVKIDSKGVVEKLIETIPEVAKFIEKNFSKK